MARVFTVTALAAFGMKAGANVAVCGPSVKTHNTCATITKNRVSSGFRCFLVSITNHQVDISHKFTTLIMAAYYRNCFLILAGHVGGALVLVAGLLGSFSSVHVSAQLLTTDDTASNEIISNIENRTNDETTTTSGYSSTGSSGMILDVSIVYASSNLTDTAFQPNPVNIKVGDTIRWTNDDNVIHTVKEGNPATGEIPEGGFDSDLMSTGQTFEYTFNMSGTFDYYCDLHHNMVGQVIVS